MDNVEKRALAKSLRAKKTPLFSTMQSIDDIIEKQGLKGESVIAVMMAVNTTLELIAQELENGNLSK